MSPSLTNLSSLRFVVCLSFYALISVSHWAPIATTTATTCAFLVAKVFQYQVSWLCCELTENYNY